MPAVLLGPDGNPINLQSESLATEYRPLHGINTFLQWQQNRLPLLTYWKICEMRTNHDIRLALRMRKAPVRKATISVECDDEILRDYVIKVLQRIWQRCLRDVLKAVEFGYSGTEIIWEDSEIGGKKVRLPCRSKGYPAIDIRPLSMDGRIVGMRLKQSSHGAQTREGVDFWGPQKLWYAFDSEAGNYFGNSALVGAQRSYEELTGKDSALDSRHHFYYRHAFRGPVIRYPNEEFRRPNLTGGGHIRVSGRDIALEMANEYKNGSALLAPNTKDPTTGEYKFTFEFPTQSANAAPDMRDYIKDLGREVSRGIEIPDEVLSGEGSGSLASRRVPERAFYAMSEDDTLEVIACCVDQIVEPAVRMLFGEAHAAFEITVEDASESTDPGQPPGMPGMHPGMPPGMPGMPMTDNPNPGGPGGPGANPGVPQSVPGGLFSLRSSVNYWRQNGRPNESVLVRGHVIVEPKRIGSVRLSKTIEPGGDSTADEYLSHLITSALKAGHRVARQTRTKLNALISRAAKLTSSTFIQMAQQIIRHDQPKAARILRDAIFASWLQGAKRLGFEVPHPTSVDDIPFQVTNEFGMTGVLQPSDPLFAPPPLKIKDLVPSDEPPVMQFPFVEAAITDLQKREILHASDFYALADQARTAAFTVSYVDATEAVEKIRDTLTEAVAEGKTLAEVRKEIKESIGTSTLGDAHIETVYRNNLQQAYSAGQERIIQDPSIITAFPYVEYMAIEDTRIRPTHHQMAHSGFMINGQRTGFYRSDDPIWDRWTPPNGHRCRCGLRYLTLRQAARAGIPEAVEWMRTGAAPTNPWFATVDVEPDPGWAHRPGVGPYASVKLSHGIDSGVQFRCAASLGHIKAGELVPLDRLDTMPGWQVVHMTGATLGRLKAPAGGINIGGKFYQGGWWIPSGKKGAAVTAAQDTLKKFNTDGKSYKTVQQLEKSLQEHLGYDAEKAAELADWHFGKDAIPSNLIGASPNAKFLAEASAELVYGGDFSPSGKTASEQESILEWYGDDDLKEKFQDKHSLASDLEAWGYSEENSLKLADTLWGLSKPENAKLGLETLVKQSPVWEKAHALNYSDLEPEAASEKLDFYSSMGFQGETEKLLKEELQAWGVDEAKAASLAAQSLKAANGGDLENAQKMFSEAVEESPAWKKIHFGESDTVPSEHAGFTKSEAQNQLDFLMSMPPSSMATSQEWEQEFQDWGYSPDEAEKIAKSFVLNAEFGEDDIAQAKITAAVKASPIWQKLHGEKPTAADETATLEDMAKDQEKWLAKVQNLPIEDHDAFLIFSNQKNLAETLEEDWGYSEDDAETLAAQLWGMKSSQQGNEAFFQAVKESPEWVKAHPAGPSPDGQQDVPAAAAQAAIMVGTLKLSPFNADDPGAFYNTLQRALNKDIDSNYKSSKLAVMATEMAAKGMSAEDISNYLSSNGAVASVDYPKQPEPEPIASIAETASGQAAEAAGGSMAGITAADASGHVSYYKSGDTAWNDESIIAAEMMAWGYSESQAQELAEKIHAKTNEDPTAGANGMIAAIALSPNWPADAETPSLIKSAATKPAPQLNADSDKEIEQAAGLLPKPMKGATAQQAKAHDVFMLKTHPTADDHDWVHAAKSLTASEIANSAKVNPKQTAAGLLSAAKALGHESNPAKVAGIVELASVDPQQAYLEWQNYAGSSPVILDKAGFNPDGTPKPAQVLSDDDIKVIDSSIGGSTGAKLVEIGGVKGILKKGGKTPEHAANEVAANRLLSLFGVAVPDSKTVMIDGKTHALNSYIDGLKKVGLDELAESSEVQKSFVAHAILGNWDAIGASVDNVFKTPDGKVVWIDNGGSMGFRAQGSPKPTTSWDAPAGDIVSELKSMRESGMSPSGAKTWGKMTDAAIAENILDLNLSYDDIRKAVLGSHLYSGQPDQAAKLDALANKVSKRLQFAKHWATAIKTGKPAPSLSNDRGAYDDWKAAYAGSQLVAPSLSQQYRAVKKSDGFTIQVQSHGKWLDYKTGVKTAAAANAMVTKWHKQQKPYAGSVTASGEVAKSAVVSQATADKLSLRIKETWLGDSQVYHVEQRNGDSWTQMAAIKTLPAAKAWMVKHAKKLGAANLSVQNVDPFAVEVIKVTDATKKMAESFTAAVTKEMESLVEGSKWKPYNATQSQFNKVAPKAGLTPTEASMVYSYTDSTYSSLNEKLRDIFKGASPPDKTVAAAASVMNSALGKMAAAQGYKTKTGYRGAHIPQEVIGKWKEAADSGDIVTEAMFLSSAKVPSKAWSGNCFIELRGSGKNCALIDKASMCASEAEVLWKSHGKYKVKIEPWSKQQQTSKSYSWYVVLEEAE
jgi:SPP1 gp7 family putative phage head morphogenesis protein